jgi:hypothetical protein
MKNVYIVIIALVCISAAAFSQTRSFHAQQFVLDNGDNTKTSTVLYAGASAQTLDLTNISTTADTFKLGLNLDLAGNNIMNGGNAALSAISANVTQMIFPFYPVGTNEYLIVNQSFFPGPIVFLPASSTNKGRILVIENPSALPFVLQIIPSNGDNINWRLPS